MCACCRAAQRLLGGRFDYCQAAQHLSNVSQAVQALTAAAAAGKTATTSSMRVGAGSVPVPVAASPGRASELIHPAAGVGADAASAGVAGDDDSSGGAAAAAAAPAAAAAVAAAAAAANEWPAVLGDVMSPLARFYDQEDAWQDLNSFSKVCNQT